MTHQDTLLSLHQVSGGYGREDVVQGISSAVGRGECIGIIGPNGSGKTTLLRLMNRVLPLSAGSVVYAGEERGVMTQRQLARRAACVLQDTFVRFPYTVEEVVLMGRIPHLGRFQPYGRADRDVARRALRQTHTEHLASRSVAELSAGERQRVMVAKALAQEPQILFLDEPTAHLDIAHQTQILDLVRQLNESDRLTIILVIHDLNAAAEYCSRLMLLANGRVFADGPADSVITYRNIESVYKAVVVESRNPITGKPFIMPVSARRSSTCSAATRSLSS